jgi:hypothetical protein
MKDFCEHDCTMRFNAGHSGVLLKARHDLLASGAGGNRKQATDGAEAEG